MSLIEVTGLSVAFGARTVVEDVGFTLERGETLAIVGESGSGKTLTALSLLRLLPGAARVMAGRIVLDGEDVVGADASALQRLRGDVAGMIFQEPMSSLNPLHRIGRQVGEAILLHRRMRRGPLRARVEALLKAAGFADAAERIDAFPHQLSGGQRQRVMIAMALANDPALLIADEPTTALDVTIQAQILELLQAEKRARGLALLLITHDLAVVRRMADRICVMQAGRIVEQGRAAEIFGAPRHDYTRALLAARPKGRPASRPHGAAPLVEARELRIHFPIRAGLLRRQVGAVRAVDGVSLAVHEGETLGLVGESGSGKTTIGLALLGLEAAEGEVLFEERAIGHLSREKLRPLRARMQIVFQDPFGSLSPRLSVGEIVAEGLAVHMRALPRAEREARVAAALEEVGLSAETAERYPHEFSGGQRQRIAIARAMILKPRFVVLDEPTSALDASVQAEIVDLLRALQVRHDLAYLFISHDLAVVRALAHRLVVLRAGRVVEEGRAEEIFAAPRETYTQALIAAAFPEAVLEPALPPRPARAASAAAAHPPQAGESG
ncbi:MAG TPA: dipeptide ABC transporter ATP-binding protein [Acetobacteraceae bacterium]|jgi:microcin C transport system ATP-binding protein|nr:dipeptide ABC transporter ATP-binding protein [Acetobacteraceae bacterium]